MARIESDMAATLSKPLSRVEPGRVQSTGRNARAIADSGGRTSEVKDTVTISRQARALAGGTKTGQLKAASVKKADLSSGVAQVKKATAALQSIPSQRMRYVIATGTVLMPGKTTTVNITG